MTDDMADWAQRYREQRTPSSATRERVWSTAVCHDLERWTDEYRKARIPPDELRARVLDSARAHTSEAQRWGAGLAVGAALGVAILVLLGFGFRMWSVAGRTAQPAPIDAPDQARPDNRSSVAEPDPAPPTATIEQSPAPTVSPAPPPVAASPRRPKRAKPQSKADAAPIDLEEIRRLRLASRQLESGRPANALTILDQHVRDYPASAFMHEREALWLRAACAVSVAPADLARRYRSFLRRPNARAYHDKVRAGCRDKKFEGEQ